MMMRMLEAAGLPLLVDDARKPDDDNPQGYYELERVKGLAQGDVGWLAEAEGRVVKVVSPLLPLLPGGRDYRLVVMVRDMEEVLASQRRMLTRRGEPVREMDDAALAAEYGESLRRAEAWAAEAPHVEAAFVDYNAILADPAAALEGLRELLGPDLDLAAMARVVDASLYRNRRPGP